MFCTFIKSNCKGGINFKGYHLPVVNCEYHSIGIILKDFVVKPLSYKNLYFFHYHAFSLVILS